MKDRKQIAEKYKWDLNPLCKSDEEFYKKLESVEEYLKEFKKFEGKLNNKNDIWKYLTLDKKFDEEIEPALLYAYLKSDEVLSDSKRAEMKEKIENIFSRFSTETAFVSSELHELSNEMLDDIIKDKKFKDYDRTFEDIKRTKKHKLSKKEEKLLAGMSFLSGFSSNMNKLSDVDIDFGSVKDSKGKSYPLDHAKYGVYMRSTDRILRKNTMEGLNGTFGKYINTLANNYICDVKADCYFAKMRKYPSALEASLFNEEVSRKVYDTLISSVHKNFDVLFDYFKLKQKQMGLKDFYIYDVMAEIDKKSNKKYTYDEAIKLIKEAVAPLGEEYVSLIQRAKDERWIDVYPNKDKRSGAYENGIYGYHPYVLSNFEGNIDSVFTLAHELGHAMHTYFSNENQPREKADYTIFLAEIASTTNEMLLLNYLLSKVKTDREKLSLYNKLFDEVKSTLFRQTMFAEFEEWVHDSYEKGESLTKDKLCEFYYNLNKQYFGKTKLIPEIKYEWARIPHFFSAFYVYKYSTGIICALNFVKKLLSEGEKGREDYFKFLTAGSSDTPINILKNAGCDLESDKPFSYTFEYLRNILKEWKNLK